VGIAGEDDLDAPDLAITVGAQPQSDSRSAPDPSLDIPPSVGASDSRLPSETADQPRSAARSKTIPLTAEDSAKWRDCLLAEIERLTREEDLDAWSVKSWRHANALARADGERVRQAFAARLDVGSCQCSSCSCQTARSSQGITLWSDSMTESRSQELQGSSAPE
jgi:hypothetical protein